MASRTPFQRSYTWTKSVFQFRGLTTMAPRRGGHRRKRERHPLPGMMLFQDGSTHAWLADVPDLDLRTYEAAKTSATPGLDAARY
jgi:hypothetical protein